MPDTRAYLSFDNEAHETVMRRLNMMPFACLVAAIEGPDAALEMVQAEVAAGPSAARVPDSHKPVSDAEAREFVISRLDSMPAKSIFEELEQHVVEAAAALDQAKLASAGAATGGSS